MPPTPDEQWRRLTAQYAEMWDDELLNLAADYNNLTEIAQQVLRGEMAKRNLGDPTAPASRPVEPEPAPLVPTAASPAPPPPSQPAAPIRPVGPEQEREWQRCKQHYAGLDDADLEHLCEEFEYLTPIAQQVLRDEMLSRGLDDPAATEEGDEYSYEGIEEESNPEFAAADLAARTADSNEWWVRMCDANDTQHARQLAIMLANANIDCRWYATQSGPIVVEVAAAQADEAERVLAQPIPQSVIDEAKIDVPAFEMPRCPHCRAADPVLLSTHPTNTWRCESCGHEWSDPIPEPQQA